MASGRIKGITIQIDGDTTGLQKALSGVDKSLKTTNAALKDVNKLLKLDPTNVDLLKQKQGYLASAIGDVKDKLDIEKRALEQLKGADSTEETTEQQKALEREIIETEQALKKYQDEWEQTESALKDAGRATDNAADSTEELAEETREAGDESRDAAGGWSMGKQALVDLAEKGAELAIQALKRLAEELKNAVIESTEFADNILTMSVVTGLSAESLQEFTYMAELLDVSVDTIAGSLTKLTNNMQSAASGSGSAAEAFDALGITVTDSEGHLRNAEDVFYDTLEALAQMENQTERDAYSMDLFGRSAQDLNPMIEAGADAIAAYAQEAHEMGYVLDHDALNALGDLDDSFQRAQNAIDTVKRQIAVQLAPVIQEITDAFIDWAQSVDWQDVAAKIGRVLDVVSNVIGFVIDNKEIVVGALVAITSALLALTIQQIALNIAMTANPIGLVIMLIGALIGVFVALEAKTHMFRDFFVQMGEQLREVAAGIRDAFVAAKNKIVQIWNTITGFFRAVWEGIQAVFRTVAEFFFERFRTGVEFVYNVWSGVTGFFSSLWEGIKSIFSHVGEFFYTVFDGARNVVSTIIDGIVAVIKAPINGVIGLINIFIRGLNRIRIPNWVPAIGGRGINIPELNYLARGGVLEKGQVGILEGSGAEAVVPLENNSRWIRAVADDMTKALQGAGQTTVNITVNAAEGQSASAIANEVMRRMQNAVNRKGAVFA